MSDPAARDAFDLARDALDRPAGERSAFLEAACGGDARLLEDATSLLRAHEAMGSFLDAPAAELLAATAPPPTVELERGTRIGRYRIESRLGLGGAGAVFLARQQRPEREVALKVLRARLLSEHAVRTFLNESELLARLSHPGVAHVYEAGTFENGGSRVPYFALEYVEDARTLTDYATTTGLGRRDRVEMMAQVCDAVHHGHQRGVVHLDLKPGNVLVDAEGRPRVIDFGIARAGEPDDEDPHAVAGTLAYMSPEQCSGDLSALDVRSDVYALGVLTFELLTGTLPVDVAGLDLGAALRRVRESEPARAADREPDLAGDLDAILAKAQSKSREERYDSAAALARDLRCHLRDEPVGAVRATWTYQLAKFARRRRLAFAALALTAVVLVAATTVSSWLAVQESRGQRRAELSAYVADLVAVQASLASSDVGAARARLVAVPESLRGWEWRLQQRQLDMSDETFRMPSQSTRTLGVADGGLAAVLLSMRDYVGGVRLVRLADGTSDLILRCPRDEARLRSLALSADGLLAAVGYDRGEIRLVDTRSREERTLVASLGAPVLALAFHHDRPWVFAGLRSGAIEVIPVGSAEPVPELEGHPDRVIALAVSPDGGRLASGGREGVVRIWDLETGARLHALAGHRSSVEDVDWSADGTLLASGSRDQSVRVWDTESGRELWDRYDHHANVRCVRFVRGTDLLATGGWDRTVRLWDAREGLPRARLRGHASRISGLEYDAASDRLVSLAMDGDVKLWTPRPRDDVPVLRGHVGRVVRLAFDSTGRFLASSSSVGCVRVWDLVAGTARVELEPVGTWGRFVTDGARPDVLSVLRSGFRDHVAFAAGGERVRHIGFGCVDAAADAWNGRAFAVGQQGSLWLVPLNATERPIRVGSERDAPRRVAVDPVRGHAAVATRTGGLVSWDLQRRRRLAVAPGAGADSFGIAISPDGEEVAVALVDGRVRLHGMPDLEPRGTLHAETVTIEAVTYSPDGARLATGGRNGVVRVWSRESPRQLLALDHGATIRALAWSCRGTLAVAHGEWEAPGVISLWEAPLEPSDGE